MRDRSNILVLGALIALFVALSTLDVSPVHLGLGTRPLLPILVIGLIVLFLMRVRCGDGPCCGTREEEEDS